MNTIQEHMAISQAHLDALRSEASIIRALQTPRVSLRHRAARWLKQLAQRLEPELQPAHAAR
jgi:hypothetical protein